MAAEEVKWVWTDPRGTYATGWRYTRQGALDEAVNRWAATCPHWARYVAKTASNLWPCDLEEIRAEFRHIMAGGQ